MEGQNTFGLSPERIAQLEENFRRVRERIDAACERSGNRDVRLVAATKYASAAEINYAYRYLGLESIGENRVQALNEKFDSLEKGLDIQFIGSLQTNKVKNIIGRVSLIQSLDSLHLAKEIDRLSQKNGLVTDCLVELNIGGEENKGGISPDEVSGFLDELEAYKGLRAVGLMTMAPVSDSDAYRKYFSETYRIYIDIVKKKIHNSIENPILSMGMSGSFEEAIECGATMVRIGSALFRE